MFSTSVESKSFISTTLSLLLWLPFFPRFVPWHLCTFALIAFLRLYYLCFIISFMYSYVMHTLMVFFLSVFSCCPLWQRMAYVRLCDAFTGNKKLASLFQHTISPLWRDPWQQDVSQVLSATALLSFDVYRTDASYLLFLLLNTPTSLDTYKLFSLTHSTLPLYVLLLLSWQMFSLSRGIFYCVIYCTFWSLTFLWEKYYFTCLMFAMQLSFSKHQMCFLLHSPVWRVAVNTMFISFLVNAELLFLILLCLCGTTIFSVILLGL